MTDIIVGIIVLGIIFFFATTIMIGCSTNSKGMEFVNPIFLYNRFKVNWFGAILLSLIFNILTLPAAIFYWIYKLCTVGRK